MHQDPNEPVVLTTTLSEVEAEAIVRELAAKGVEARSMGEGLAGFRAMTPAVARVVVRRADRERAVGALDEVRRENREIDWSRVDVQEGRVAPEGEPAEPLPFPQGGRKGGGKRALWTLALVIMLPIGLLLTFLFSGQPHYDQVVRAIGPIIIGAAAVIVVMLLVAQRDEEAEKAGEGPFRE